MEILLLSCAYRRNAEELLWKKVFYDLVQKSKSNRQVCILYIIHVHVLGSLLRSEERRVGKEC